MLVAPFWGVRGGGRASGWCRSHGTYDGKGGWNAHKYEERGMSFSGGSFIIMHDNSVFMTLSRCAFGQGNENIVVLHDSKRATTCVSVTYMSWHAQHARMFRTMSLVLKHGRNHAACRCAADQGVLWRWCYWLQVGINVRNAPYYVNH